MLEASLFEGLAHARHQNPLHEITVVVPTGRLRAHLERRLLSGLPGVLNIHWLTVMDLAERVLADAPPRPDRLLTEPALETEMIRDCLEGTAPMPFQLRSEFLGPSLSVPRGLPAALAGTLKDLRDSGARVDHAMQAVTEGHLGAEGVPAAPILELYGLLYRYRRELGLITTSDFLRHAADHAPKSAFLARQSRVRVYGFYDFTGVQLDLVAALSAHPDAELFIPYVDGNAAYAFAERLVLDPQLQSKVSRSEAATSSGERSSAHDRSVGGTEVQTLVVSCSGLRDEVWWVAKEMVAAQDDGVPASEMAVIARDITAYLPLVRELFATHAIPWTASQAEKAGASPWLKALRQRLREEKENPMAPWGDHLRWANDLLAQQPTDALTPGAADQLRSLAAMTVLKNAIPRARFIAAWEERLNALTWPLPPASRGVQVLSAAQARGLRFRRVFLIGMNEKVFPRLIREDPFLSDAARGALSQALGCRLARKLDGYAEERLLFELMRQTASEHLTLVWQRTDEEGKVRLASGYIDEDLRNHHDKARRLPRSWPDKLADRPAHQWTPKELSFILNRAGADPEPLYAALGWNGAAFNRLLRAHRAAESFRPGILEFDGRIGSDPRLQSVMARGFSPSGLERLAECPYQFFGTHVLRLPIPDEAVRRGAPRSSALGKLFHRALELTFRLRDLSAACAQAMEEFRTLYPPVYPLVLKSVQATLFQSLSTFLENEKEDLAATGFEPAYAELEVEGPLPELGAGLAATSFHGRIDRLDLRRRADSVTGRVVDYKSGKADRVGGRLETALARGRFLQLPIYMALAQRFLQKEHPGATVEAAALRWLRPEDQEADPPELPAAYWQSSASLLFRENMNELVKLVEKGHFYIVPDTGEGGHCRRCALARVCRKEHLPTRARAEKDATREKVQAVLSRKVGPL